MLVLFYCILLNKCKQCLHKVAVPEGMYIATYYCWRSGQSCAVPEEDGTAFYIILMTLELAPRVAQVSKNSITDARTPQ